MTFEYSALLVCGFLLGSVPFGFLIGRAKGIDIRKVGSGNIGATNVNRALGSRLGIFVFLLDVMKALLPVLAARFLIHAPMWGMPAQLLWFFAGACAVLGHMFSPWLGFKGGKGIASGLGAILGAAPVVGLLCFAIFAVVLALTRYVSLGSIIAVICLPILGFLIPGESPELAAIYCLFTAFIVYKHRANMVRIRDGTESKFAFSKSSSAEAVTGEPGPGPS